MFDAIRAACARVAARSRFVRVAPPDVLERYALSLAPEGAAAPSWDDAHHFRDPSDPHATAAYVLALDAVNFGSGWFPVLAKRPGLSGYYTVSTRLADRFRAAGPPSPAELRELGAAEVAAWLGQPLGEDAGRDELMGLFARALRDLGAWLEPRGGALEAVRAAEGSAERLALDLTEMPLFRDAPLYDPPGRAGAGAAGGGRDRAFEVPLYKRAQIAPSDLALAFGGAAPADFRDLDRMTIFADNLVPHVLRVDGALAYEPELAERLAAGEGLEPGSPEEVEIRACAVHAVEGIAAALRARGRPATARDLDVLLWERGRAERYRGPERHRTRTTAY